VARCLTCLLGLCPAACLLAGILEMLERVATSKGLTYSEWFEVRCPLALRPFAGGGCCRLLLAYWCWGLPVACCGLLQGCCD
jgi:hypothetical protein